MWSALETLFGRKPAIKYIDVHFAKKKLRVSFSSGDYDASKHVPLNAFRLRLASALNVPPRELALYQINPQRKLSNMKTTLEDYGLKNGDEILAVHVNGGEPSASSAAPTAAPKKLSANERVDEIMASLDAEVGGRIAKVLTEGAPRNAGQRETEHRVLSETVLAKTISLDDVEVQTPEERQYRKGAIAKLQKYHKDIDLAMAKAAADNSGEPEANVLADSATPAESSASTMPGTSTKSDSKLEAKPESDQGELATAAQTFPTQGISQSYPAAAGVPGEAAEQTSVVTDPMPPGAAVAPAPLSDPAMATTSEQEGQNAAAPAVLETGNSTDASSVSAAAPEGKRPGAQANKKKNNKNKKRKGKR